MAVCELCGKDARLMPAMIESTELEVCEACGTFGKVKAPRQQMQRTSKPVVLPEELEQNEIMVDNFALMIKNAREKLGLKQQELAQKISEKESVIHHIETGHEPPMVLARKLERALHIKIVQHVQEAAMTKGTKSGEMTIGDIVKVY